MKLFKKILIIMGLFYILSCEKEISITEFSDDFSNYEAQLRIEAVILPTESTAIVRVDKSVLITNTSLYDCIDNDGDWNPLIHDVGIDGKIGDPNDENENCGDCSFNDDACQESCRDEDSIGENNGIPDCGEPNVDNYSEFLPDIHQNNCTVSMTKTTFDGNAPNAPETCNFSFQDDVGEFFDTRYTGSGGNNIVDDFVTVNYGAYVPGENCSTEMFSYIYVDETINTKPEYTFIADCTESGFGIVSSNKPINISDPVVFVDTIQNNPAQNPESQGDIDEYLDELGIKNCTNHECLNANLANNDWYEDLNENGIRDEDELVYFPRYSQFASIIWATISPNVYFQATQYMYDSSMSEKLYHGHPAVGTDFFNIVNDVCLMNETIVTDFYDGYGNNEWDGESDDEDSKDEPEIFADENGNGIYDREEIFDDTNGNGYYDEGEFYEDLGSDGVPDLFEDGCGYSLPRFIKDFYNFEAIINELEIDYSNFESQLIILDSLILLNDKQELIDENKNFIICGGNSIEDPNNDNWNDCGSDNNCESIDIDNTQNNNIWDIGEGNEDNNQFDNREFFIDTGDDIGDIDTYYYEISTFSESYKNYYFYSRLLLNDPERTNLRDENLNPVMGSFGSITTNKIDFKLIDCLDYLYDEDSCIDPTKTHGVCSWHPNVIIDDYEGSACLPINWDL